MFKDLLTELKCFKHQITLKVLLSKATSSDDAMKGLINIKNNDNKCFLWYHVRHLNRNGVKLERITKKNKEIVKKIKLQWC